MNKRSCKKSTDVSAETKHHKKPRSIGGKNHDSNISIVVRGMHNHWHTLFGNLSGDLIFSLIEDDLVVHNIFPCLEIKKCIFDIPSYLYEQAGGSYESKNPLKRKIAWYNLFQGKTLEQGIHDFNHLWLDPLYFVGVDKKRLVLCER